MGVDNNFSPTLNQVRDLLPRWSVGVALSVPLGNRGARGSYGQATAARDRVGLQVKQLHQDILVEVENAVGTAQGSFQRVTATREARLAAEAAYDAEVKKLENGKSTRLQRFVSAKRFNDGAVAGNPGLGRLQQSAGRVMLFRRNNSR